MYNVLVVDGRRNLADDIKLQLLVEGYNEDELSMTATAPANSDDLIRFIGPKRYDYVLVEHDMLDGRCRVSDFSGAKVYGYSNKKEEPVNFDKDGIPFMGYASRSEDIIRIAMDCINGKVPIAPPKEESDKKAPEKQEEPATPVVIEEEEDEKPEEKPAATPKTDNLQSILDGNDDDSEYVPPQVTPARPVRKEPQELVGERLRKDQVAQAEAVYRSSYEEAVKPAERKTTVISSFSGKGGVGKSTLAANLALYLSMIPHGRGTYRVCLVDYNVESGDIRSILGINSGNSHAMNEWSEEIHAQMARGRNPQDIIYSATQMAPYLTPYKSKSTLSVLLAPQLHEDAQFIEGDHLQIMLRNIIENGDFDFVICDTADNTYDGTYCALSMSDLVLLICTQDVTTANRNDSVMRSLQRSNIDLTKFRLVVNNVSSKRRTGISVDEIKKFFKDYECVGVIHEMPEVTYANNNSTPLIYKPSNQFTKDLQTIVQYLIKDSNARAEPKKRGLIARILDK